VKFGGKKNNSLIKLLKVQLQGKFLKGGIVQKSGTPFLPQSPSFFASYPKALARMRESLLSLRERAVAAFLQAKEASPKLSLSEW
jgi:hypothetical protein